MTKLYEMFGVRNRDAFKNPIVALLNRYQAEPNCSAHANRKLQGGWDGRGHDTVSVRDGGVVEPFGQADDGPEDD